MEGCDLGEVPLGWLRSKWRQNSGDSSPVCPGVQQHYLFLSREQKTNFARLDPSVEMRFLLLCVAGLALACAAAAPPSASLATLTKKPLPNIVYIMTDDQGIYT